jgi:hypothetical protein
MTDRRIGNQAAYERLVSEELCYKLAGGFARKSAERTKTDDDIGSIRFSYSIIVKELVSMRETQPGGQRYSLSNVLQRDYETDEALKQFLPKLSKWIADYVSYCIRGEQGPTRTLCGHRASAELMKALAQEYVRDRDGLMRFLSAMFRQWRKILEPRSLWRVRLVTQQIASRFGYDRKRILNHLQKIGAVPSNLTADQINSWFSKIGQILSRDQRTAIGKDFGFRHRTKPTSFGALLKPKPKEEIGDRNQLTVS